MNHLSEREMRRKRGWIAAAFAAGLVAGALPLWPIPYSQVSMMEGSSLPLAWQISSGLVAILIAGASPLGPIKTILVVGSGVPMAVLLRAVVEGTIDPSTHNLLPFEVILSIWIVALPVIGGAFLGYVLKKDLASRRGSDEDGDEPGEEN